MTARDEVMLDLIRPQYAPNSEVLLSAVVQPCYEAAEDKARSGFRFLNRNPQSKNEVTAPVDAAGYESFAAQLAAQGIKTNGTSEDLARAVVAAVTGVGSGKATSLPASPMAPHLALAQDLAGVLGSNPPNLGKALEHMFLMGEAPDDPGPDSLAESWLEAASARRDSEPLLAGIDEAFNYAHSSGPFSRNDKVGPSLNPTWRGAFPKSPYGWFNRSWRRLMDPAWIDLMPTRVWTDWVTTVLRTALAFGYLAEMRWYELMGEAMLGRDSIDTLPVLDREELLPWPPSRLPVSSRNVKTDIRLLVNRGTSMRELLDRQLASAGDVPGASALEALRLDPEVRSLVVRALGGHEPPRSEKNVRETITYALQQRGTDSNSDYYGLLKNHGSRYAVVSPGTEWMAVVASLACDPSGQTNVGQVLSEIECLGMLPEVQELVGALEAAGMARGSADADHGVRVRSAF